MPFDWPRTASCCATSRSVPVPALKPLLDRLENARRAGDVVLGGAKPVLRGQHLEIGIGDAGQRGERDHVAIEAVGDRGFLRGLRGVAVLAPEIEFIAGAERGRIVDDLASAIGQPAGARARVAGIGLLPGAAQARQQCRACDTRLRVGLDEAGGGGRDVQIDRLGILHQGGQFPRTKPAPPVERRRRIRIDQSCGLVAVGNIQRRIGQILGQDATHRTRDNAQRCEPSCHATHARPRNGQTPRI